jgi:hypothetical protein
VGGWTVAYGQVSVLEVYNNAITDLLAPEGTPADTKYELRTRKDGAMEVTNLTDVPVTTVHDALHTIDRAFRQRAVAATDLNAHSSRSHWCVHGADIVRVYGVCACVRVWVTWAARMASVVTVQVAADERAAVPSKLRRSKLSFVDLAGSECLGLSNATGAAAQETAHINKSLSALADVILALGSVRHHHAHWPPRKGTQGMRSYARCATVCQRALVFVCVCVLGA